MIYWFALVVVLFTIGLQAYLKGMGEYHKRKNDE